jgi:S-DNA-T family DNA segregation ATPase FtsK/SpoIIIE
MPPGEGDKRDVVPDEARSSTPCATSVSPAQQAVKDGWQPRWVSPTTRLGNGWHTQLQLPLGTTVEAIADKKVVLAHNLMRKPIEVWPTEPRDQAGVLDLWVADSGVLTKPVPSWPLLTGTADFFKGVPVALNARGEQVIGRLMAQCLLAGSRVRSKSSLVVALLLGAMLDPLVEIDVHVWRTTPTDAMRPVCGAWSGVTTTSTWLPLWTRCAHWPSEVSRRGQERNASARTPGHSRDGGTRPVHASADRRV